MRYSSRGRRSGRVRFGRRRNRNRTRQKKYYYVSRGGIRL